MGERLHAVKEAVKDKAIRAVALAAAVVAVGACMPAKSRSPQLGQPRTPACYSDLGEQSGARELEDAMETGGTITVDLGVSEVFVDPNGITCEFANNPDGLDGSGDFVARADGPATTNIRVGKFTKQSSAASPDAEFDVAVDGIRIENGQIIGDRLDGGGPVPISAPAHDRAIAHG